MTSRRRPPLGAGLIQPERAVRVGQADDALGGTEPEQRRCLEQFVDHRDAAVADLGALARHPSGVRCWNAIFSGG